MQIGDSLNSAYSTLVSRPSDILPFYLIGSSVAAIARVVPLLGIFASYAVLSYQGRIEEFREELRGLNLSELEEQTPSSEINPEDLPINRLEDAMAQIITPEVVAIVALSFLAFVGVYIILNSVVSAAKIHAIYSSLTYLSTPDTTEEEEPGGNRNRRKP
ncbi:MAG: hypothetical protein SV377_05175 [Halobacteria archaeon]|nr:hypothetical protein [Halobacteria archaeon]